MLITVRESKSVWKSPDGQREIWDLTDSEGNTWSTMSKQISQAIGQTMELTTRVSSKGKTYLIKPVEGQEAPSKPVDGISGPEAADALSKAADRLIEAADRLQKAADRFIGRDDRPPIDAYDEELEGKDLVDDL